MEAETQTSPKPADDREGGSGRGEERNALLAELGAALRESPRLRALAGRLGRWLETALQEIDEGECPRTEDRVGDVEIEPVRLEERRLTLGRAQAVVEVRDTGEAPSPPPVPVPVPPMPKPEAGASSVAVEPNLALLVRRAHLEAECCRWAIKRRRRLEAGDEFEDAIKPRDKELGRASRELDTFPWPLDPDVSLPPDSELEDLACCYENTASAMELARDTRNDEELGHDYVRSAFQLAAEAQSALRIGLLLFAEREHDDVQYDAFRWLRLRTATDRVYVPRYMQLNDPADPTRWHDLQQEIEKLREDWETRKQRTRRRNNLLGKVRYHVQRVEKAGDGENQEDWSRIDTAVGDLLEDGLPPSNVKLRDLLLPVLERLPDGFECGEGLHRVLEAVDSFLAGREVESGRVPREREPSEEVKQVARLLRGRTVVLIGGQVRPKSREALERSFELSSLHWISASPGTSFSTFEPAVARTDTALVLLAIRWISHGFSQVSDLCRRHDKPLVRLPAGYNPNQVARQVLEQVGDRLSG